MASRLILSRGYATSRVAEQLIKPQIQLFGMEGKYAHAMYSAAAKEKKLDQIDANLQTLTSTLKKDKPFSDFMANPTIAKKDKVDGLTGACNKLKIDKLTLNALTVMAENGVLGKLNGIIAAFSKLMASHRGQVICTVTSAEPLDNSTTKEVTASLKQFAKQGQELIIGFQTDSSLMGGLIVEIGDKYVDMSIASKLKTYEGLLKEAI